MTAHVPVGRRNPDAPPGLTPQPQQGAEVAAASHVPVGRHDTANPPPQQQQASGHAGLATQYWAIQGGPATTNVPVGRHNTATPQQQQGAGSAEPSHVPVGRR